MTYKVFWALHRHPTHPPNDLGLVARGRRDSVGTCCSVGGEPRRLSPCIKSKRPDKAKHAPEFGQEGPRGAAQVSGAPACGSRTVRVCRIARRTASPLIKHTSTENPRELSESERHSFVAGSPKRLGALTSRHENGSSEDFALDGKCGQRLPREKPTP